MDEAGFRDIKPWASAAVWEKQGWHAQLSEAKRCPSALPAVLSLNEHQSEQQLKHKRYPHFSGKMLAGCLGITIRPVWSPDGKIDTQLRRSIALFASK